jgi:Carboxypeptidase regulatory-like domain
MTRVIASFCGILVMALTPVSAGAHGLGIEGRLRGGTLHLEAYFDDNSPVAHAQVRLLNQENKTLVEAETNTEGVYTLPTPAPGTYRVEIRGEDGHFAKASLKIPEPPVPDGTLVSEGLTRAERTGARKWGMAVFGLLVIAAGAAMLNWVFKGLKKRPATR